MAFADLREFLACLEKNGELIHISRPIALEHELGAVTYKHSQSAGPALMFDRPSNSSVPVVVEHMSSWRRLALALDVPIEDIHAEFNRRVAMPMATRSVATGLCKENVL